jgi:hypothetical protein
MTHTEYILNESEHDIGFVAANVLVFNGKTAIDNQPEVSEAIKLQPHNMLAAHMFNVLTGCQAMQQLQINVSKNNTIHSLLQKRFPAIKSSDNKPKYYVTPKTIGYIHGIVTYCITRLPSDACNQCTLQNEIMILEVLAAQEPAVFRHQLFNTLTKYYEEIQSMSGAGGRPKPKHFKRTMIADEEAAAQAGGEPIEEAAAEAGDNAPEPPPPPPAAEYAAPDNLATPPAKKAGT